MQSKHFNSLSQLLSKSSKVSTFYLNILSPNHTNHFLKHVHTILTNFVLTWSFAKPNLSLSAALE